MSSLEIKNLHVAIGEKEIVKGFNLTINSGEVHAIMGPNGTGKSTLAKVIAGHPDYTITGGDVLLDGKSILEFEADERAEAALERGGEHGGGAKPPFGVWSWPAPAREGAAGGRACPAKARPKGGPH